MNSLKGCLETYIIKCSDFLGELTDEFEEGLYIWELATTGPKSYSLKVLNNNTGEIKYLTKCKDFTINSDDLLIKLDW